MSAFTVTTYGVGAPQRYPPVRFIRDGAEPRVRQPASFSNERYTGAAFDAAALGPRSEELAR